MKIKCEYCENFFDDTLEQCPHCGAPNKSIRRSTVDQPTTVEELKEWYSSHGLPPAEVTRFFIGEDYKDPKAFGIFKDENTGNFVVYKNKADGSRAVRYEGTDEAFAVNEIYMRLKQEILEQKAHNIKSASEAGTPKTAESGTNTSAGSKKKLILFLVVLLGGGMLFFGIIIFWFVQGLIQGARTPKDGYYQKGGKTYYYYSEPVQSGWAVYDNNDWIETDVNEDLANWKNGEAYYQGEAYNNALGVSDFTQSLLYGDVTHECAQGYYKNEDRDYYYLPSAYGGWYYFDESNSDWSPISKSDLPADLKHSSTAESFWYTPTWDSSTQITDFESSSYYSEYVDNTSPKDDSDSDYSWDSGDSWDSGGTDWDSDW